MITRVYLGVGSNLGERAYYMEAAEKALRENPAVSFLGTSSVYETKPVGGPSQGLFLNAVWEIETDMPPRALLETLHGIERSLGRNRRFQNEPRTIDLDILFYGDLVIKERDLEIPHPRVLERWFVLKPLSDLAPDFIHPVARKSVKELLENSHAAS